MPRNTRTVSLVGSKKLGITSASFETTLGNHECERIKQGGFLGGGDYVLECDQLPTERPIRRIHIYTSKGAYTCDVPSHLQNEWSIKIRV